MHTWLKWKKNLNYFRGRSGRILNVNVMLSAYVGYRNGLQLKDFKPLLCFADLSTALKETKRKRTKRRLRRRKKRRKRRTQQTLQRPKQERRTNRRRRKSLTARRRRPRLIKTRGRRTRKKRRARTTGNPLRKSVTCPTTARQRKAWRWRRALRLDLWSLPCPDLKGSSLNGVRHLANTHVVLHSCLMSEPLFSIPGHLKIYHYHCFVWRRTPGMFLSEAF